VAALKASSAVPRGLIAALWRDPAHCGERRDDLVDGGQPEGALVGVVVGRVDRLGVLLEAGDPGDRAVVGGDARAAQELRRSLPAVIGRP
jgi:hypothetical protein